MPYVDLVLVAMIAAAHTLAQHNPLHKLATDPDNADISLSTPSTDFERFASMSAMNLQSDSLETASELCGYYSGASLRHPIHAHPFTSAGLI